MAEVARRAGVAPATVARVLYSNGYVTEEKRVAVEAAVAAVGYRPNMMARALRTSRSHTLGMVVSEAHLNAFHPYVAHEVQLEALRHGYTVLSINNRSGNDVERQGVQRFIDQHVDAIIFCTAASADNVHLAAASGVPCIQIEREVGTGGCLVLADPNPGMREAVQHLKAFGHERIAYIGGHFDIVPTEHPRHRRVEAQRLAAFKDAMRSEGLAFDPLLVRLGPYYGGGEGPLPGRSHMDALLAANPPTAIIAGADLLAAGAIQSINGAGLSVPGDISIIGYDNITAELLTPPLTSIAQPLADFGASAVQLALEAIANPDRPRQIRTYPTWLVVRQSTGPVRRDGAH